MIYFPGTIIQWTQCYMGIYTYCWLCTLTLTLCMIVPWSCDGVVFLASTHLATSSLLPCPDSTVAHRPPLGAPVPPPPKWRPSPRVRAHSLSRVQNKSETKTRGKKTSIWVHIVRRFAGSLVECAGCMIFLPCCMYTHTSGPPCQDYIFVSIFFTFCDKISKIHTTAV